MVTSIISPRGHKNQKTWRLISILGLVNLSSKGTFFFKEFYSKKKI